MNEVSVDQTITLKILDDEYELTSQEARQLHRQLGEILSTRPEPWVWPVRNPWFGPVYSTGSPTNTITVGSPNTAPVLPPLNTSVTA